MILDNSSKWLLGIFLTLNFLLDLTLEVILYLHLLDWGVLSLQYLTITTWLLTPLFTLMIPLLLFLLNTILFRHEIFDLLGQLILISYHLTWSILPLSNPKLLGWWTSLAIIMLSIQSLHLLLLILTLVIRLILKRRRDYMME